jgi:hypothetical protein
MLTLGAMHSALRMPLPAEEPEMKRLVLATLCLALVATVASAAEFEGLTLTPRGTAELGAKGNVFPSAATASSTVYSNITNFLGQGYANGGAALQSGNTITRLSADDLTPLSGYGGLNVSLLTFSVANFNAAAVSARARIRFYLADGASGGPGTVLAGFSFNPISFPVGVSLWSFNPAGAMTLPLAPFWAGVTFDNNAGGTGATAAQLNGLGQGMFDPPTVGTSADQFFVTSAAGSFLASNPAGTLGNFGGAPPANFGWAFDVEQPVPAMQSTWGRVKSLYR